MSKIDFRCQFKDKVIRFRVPMPDDNHKMTYKKFTDMLIKGFKIQVEKQQTVYFEYKDEEHDYITIKSETEFNENINDIVNCIINFGSDVVNIQLKIDENNGVAFSHAPILNKLTDKQNLKNRSLISEVKNKIEEDSEQSKTQASSKANEGQKKSPSSLDDKVIEDNSEKSLASNVSAGSSAS